MQAGVEQGANQSIDRRDAGPCFRLRHGPPELVDIFVANDNHVVFIGGIGIAVASLQPHQQLARQSEGLVNS